MQKSIKADSIIVMIFALSFCKRKLHKYASSCKATFGYGKIWGLTTNMIRYDPYSDCILLLNTSLFWIRGRHNHKILPLSQKLPERSHMLIHVHMFSHRNSWELWAKLDLHPSSSYKMHHFDTVQVGWVHPISLFRYFDVTTTTWHPGDDVHFAGTGGKLQGCQSTGRPGGWSGKMMGKWWEITLWLCQNSYWKSPLIVDFPIKTGDFQ
jgi:hypothetical protein